MRLLTLILTAATLSLVPMHASLAQKVDLAEAAKLVVDKTNAFRAEHKLTPVKKDEALQAAAKKFAEFMAENNKYGHHADGRSPAERAVAAGYEYCAIRENIAYRSDSRDLDATFLGKHFTESWIDSPEHRENMLAALVTETGVAMATSDGTTYFAVQMFGRPKSMAYHIELVNRSEQAWTLQIESNGNSDEIELPPRGRLQMKRCFPVLMKIAGTDVSMQVKDSTKLEITSGKDGPVFAESSLQSKAGNNE